MSKKIFITGCAKTGTTLLLRMFYAFKSTDVLYKEGFNGHEISLDDFLEYESDNNFIIGKRLPPCLLSNEYYRNKTKFKEQKKKIIDNEIGIINVVRDGRDVVLSDGGYVTPQRWIDSMKQSKEFKDIVNIEIKYEDLLTEPDNIQQQLVDTFGIEKEHNFSNYPDYVEDWVYEWNPSILKRKKQSTHTNYDKRALNGAHIGRNPTAYVNKCTSREQLAEFNKQLSDFNYGNII